MNANYVTLIRIVALAEWRAMLRNRVAIAAGLLLLALTLAAILVSYEQMRAVTAERTRFQASADQQWDAQPDRHPHRVVHYGHFIFRPLSPLAFFDFGVDPFTGHTLFLEGHRQNSANFSDAGQSSVLLRFGQLTPAFVLQVLTPLLIAFLAFGSVAREREQGQLRLSMAQGVRGTSLLAGKLASHALVAMLLASPALLALGAIGALYPEMRTQVVWLLAGYSMYLLVWVFVAVLVSAAVPRARDALLTLVACWIVTVILLPRAMPDLAAARLAGPTRIETEVALHQQMASLGDSHNPNDPYFARFRARTLAAYGVARVEDLPVNYGGLVIEEGERLTSALFDQSMRAEYQLQVAQSAIVYSAAALSPVIALRRLSTALAGTDLDSHARFLLEGEKYRYTLVQRLNRLHVNEVRYANDRDQRISQEHWRGMPRFAYQAEPVDTVLERHVWPGLALFAGWLLVLCVLARRVALQLERSPQ